MARRRRGGDSNSTGIISIITSSIGAAALIGVAILQVTDDPPPPAPPPPLSCSVVRGEVLDQAEQNPTSLEIPYPEDSPEEEQCDINAFIAEIEASPPPLDPDKQPPVGP